MKRGVHEISRAVMRFVLYITSHSFQNRQKKIKCKDCGSVMWADNLKRQ